MSDSNKRYYTCFVPSCPNTTITAPDKRFLHVPRHKTRRTDWWIAAGRDFPMLYWDCYCCEDHFNLEDVENYLYMKLMGGKAKFKQGVVPHKFECQLRDKIKTENEEVVARKRLHQDHEPLDEKENLSEASPPVSSDEAQNEEETIYIFNPPIEDMEAERKMDCWEGNVEDELVGLVKDHPLLWNGPIPENQREALEGNKITADQSSMLSDVPVIKPDHSSEGSNSSSPVPSFSLPSVQPTLPSNAVATSLKVKTVRRSAPSLQCKRMHKVDQSDKHTSEKPIQVISRMKEKPSYGDACAKMVKITFLQLNEDQQLTLFRKMCVLLSNEHK